MSHEQQLKSTILEEVGTDKKEGTIETSTTKLLGSETLKLVEPNDDYDIDDDEADLLFDDVPEPKIDYTTEGWKPDAYQLAYYANCPEDYNSMRRGDGFEEIAEADFQRVLSELSQDEKVEFDMNFAALHKDAEVAKKAQERIEQQAHYLYKGTLPVQFMDRLNAIAPESRREGKYAILVNQSSQVDINEATEYLKNEGGIDLGAFYGISHRFMAIPGHYLDQKRDDFASSEEYLKSAINKGYYGNSNIGRYIVYAPLNDGVQYAGELSYGESYAQEPGLTTPGVNGAGEKTEVVKAMYVYSFIDGEGTVWVNNNYLLSDKPDFATSESARI